MIKKEKFYFLGITLFLISLMALSRTLTNNNLETAEIQATVLYSENNKLMIQDTKNIIYTFETDEINVDVGTKILIKYNGVLENNKNNESRKIISYTTTTVSKDEENIPNEWSDNGIFKTFYNLAYKKLKTLSLDEKIGQLFLVRYQNDNIITDLNKYKFGGYVFFEKDFKEKTEEEVKNMINQLQNNSKIPLLTAVDEEGGKVVRVSNNPNLSPEKFKSSQELYNLGGFPKIKEDTKEKSKILKKIGLNLNLAPVIDVSVNPNDYIFERSFGKNTELTSIYAKTVIESSKGTDVSYTLKHFPGYGNNKDTHTGPTIDTRSYEEIVNNDLPPFEAGIEAGAEAILVNHNTINSIDPNNPASLSPTIHNILRDDLNFSGIIITDDLTMGAVSSIENATLKAILAGNDLIITSDYNTAISTVKTAIEDGTISENLIDKLAFRILAWKYYKGIMTENQK